MTVTAVDGDPNATVGSEWETARDDAIAVLTLVYRVLTETATCDMGTLAATVDIAIRALART